MKMLFSAIRAAFWAAGALILAAAGFIAFAAATYAAGDAVGTAVSIPWGDWLSSLAPGILDIALAALATAFAWAGRRLPSSVVSLLSTLQVEQLLARSVTYAINATAGAEHDKVLSVKVGNQVLAEAITYAEVHGPAWLLQFIGSPEQLATKLIARLKLSSDATIAKQMTGGPVAGGLAIVSGAPAAPPNAATAS